MGGGGEGEGGGGEGDGGAGDGEGGFGDNQKVENFPVTLGTLDHWRKTEVPEREAEMTTDEFVEMSKKKVWELKDMLSEASSATWAHKNKRATRWQEMRKLAARFDNRDMETKKAVYARPAPGTGPTAEEIKRLNAETAAAAAAAAAVVEEEEEEEVIVDEDVLSLLLLFAPLLELSTITT